MDIFGLLHEKIKLKGKVRMFEAFSGVGTQAMALKRVTDNYEIVGFSEIDKYAIQSYRAIHGDEIKNYGDITKMTEIPECDIFTWSFPCTDLSKAGKQAGMNVGTRSGLVYEVLRLVRDTKNKPKVLIMENVVDLIQVKFSRQFGEIQLELERMGYMNYVDVLNAKDYGVAQNRERVFMVSILGEYSYEFPKREKLVKRLKDYLEPVVDEKYYLSDKMLAYVTGTSNGWDRQFRPLEKESEHSHTITGREGNVAESTYVKDDEPKIAYALQSREFAAQGWVNECPALAARDYKDPKVVMIPEATVQGYALAEDGDGVYINRPHQKRGVVQKGMIQTIKTNGDDVGVVVSDFSEVEEQMITPDGNIKRYIKSDVVDEFEDGDCADISFPNGYNKANRVFKGYAPAINTTTTKSFITKTNLRIRKLTPRECGRLMDISDDDIDKMLSVVSNSQAYKQFGNAIVVRVFEKILKEIV